MTLLYHLHTPPPVLEGTEGVQQEIKALRAQLGGELIFLVRNRHLQTPAHKWLTGLRQLPWLRHAESAIQFHLVFYSELFPFLYLLGLNKPVIYSVVSGLGDRELLPPRGVLRRIKKVVVTNTGDAEWLDHRGIHNVTIIKPGIEAAHFTCTVPPTDQAFTVIAGSAPWVKQQFVTKGIETLLQAANSLPWLRIIFLWRGVMYQEMMSRVIELGLRERVEVVNELTNMNVVFGRAHAGVLLASRARHAMAYPHSLLEALAAGKPVITSDRIPISEYVREKGCGLSIDGVSLSSFLGAIQSLREDYPRFQQAALTTGARDFPLQAMVAGYETLLNNLRGSPRRG